MKTLRLLPFLLAAACAGPGQQRLSETPTAQTPATPSLAPAPAGTADRDRERVVQQFDDMRDAQQAHREAANTPETTPPKTPVPPPPPGPPGTPLPPTTDPAQP
jgi:hypothetical protein